MFRRTSRILLLAALAALPTAGGQTTGQIEAGLNWLLANRESDGSWATGSPTGDFRATLAAAEILREARPSSFDATSARRWLERFDPDNMEALAGQARLAGIAPPVDFVPTYSLGGFFDIFTDWRNPYDFSSSNPNAPEGGWGFAEGYATSTIDTALALRAFANGLPVGLVLEDEPITNGQVRQFAFDLPADATSIGIQVTGATATIDVRISNDAPPTLANPYFRITSTPVNLSITDAGPGRNFLRIDGLGNGTFGIAVSFTSSQFDGEAWSEALAYLQAARNPDGGWGLQKGEPSGIFATAQVLAALDDCRTGFRSSQVIGAGAAWLAANQNGDGSFGDPTSDVALTAVAYQGLSAANPNSAAAQAAENYLIAAQAGAGHWNSDPLATALATRALRFSLRDIDADTDGTPDIFDNCPGLSNPDQIDTDSDGLGNACDPDDDNDGLTDAFESTQAGTDPLLAFTLGEGIPDGELDLDLDGRTALQEQAAGSDPSAPNLSLKRGLNLFTYPVTPPGGFTAFQLMSQLGGSGAVDKVLKLNPANGLYREARYSGTTPAGDNFPIAGGDGMLLYLKADQLRTFSGTVVLTPPQLYSGPNVVRFPSILPGDRTFDLFVALIDQGETTSIQRYDTRTGRFQTASTSNGQPTGSGFPVYPSETYLVHMNEARPRFVITSPLPGATVTGSPINVTGQIGPNVTSVVINGVSASLSNGTFSASIQLDPGPNTIDAAAFASQTNYTPRKFTVNFGSAVDYTIAPGGSASGSRQFSAPQGSQAASYSVTLNGVPPGLTYQTTNVTVNGNNVFTVSFTISAAGGMAPGDYAFTATYELEDAGGNPITPLNGNVMNFTVRVQ